MHRSVDRRSGATSPVEAEVERSHHLVLALLTRVDLHEGAEAVEAEHGEPGSVSVPRSPPDPFTHSNSTSRPVAGSVSTPLAEVLPPA